MNKVAIFKLYPDTFKLKALVNMSKLIGLIHGKLVTVDFVYKDEIRVNLNFC